MKKRFKSFEEAKKFVHSLNLGSKKEWDNFCKRGNRPPDIPFSVHKVYKNNGWENWGDFLGTGKTSTRYKQFKSYDEAKEFVGTGSV